MQDQSNAGSEQEQSEKFNGAAIIAENGEEIPITEEMIQRACAQIDPDQEQPEQD